MKNEQIFFDLKGKFPLIKDILSLNTVFWVNPLKKDSNYFDQKEFSFDDIIDAERRLKRFASYLSVAFPEINDFNGIIESDLKYIPSMKSYIEDNFNIKLPGNLILKCDHSLPISGSIKARGGIYEVLKVAETLALKEGLLSIDDDYSKLYDDSFKQFFKQYKIAVGSTGNLGLSIGIMAAKLGFRVTVHMSKEAKEWKKQLLREKGVEVIEYNYDFTVAVEEGRKIALLDPSCHFIDDENSKDLFAGYSVASLRLKDQLNQLNIIVDDDHPLFVYFPCGVGGGPGGISYGLKSIYGKNVHIFFGEPLQSPCLLLGMMTGYHDKISVQDIGLTNNTEADGLAVGRPSKLVCKLMESILSGCYTVDDKFLFESLKAMYKEENIFMEPSAHASMYGPIQLIKNEEGQRYLKENNLLNKLDQCTHIIWSTGGDMVPYEQKKQYLNYKCKV